MPPKKKGRKPAGRAANPRQGEKRAAEDQIVAAGPVPDDPTFLGGDLGAKRRQLDRRDSDERVTRAIGTRLDFLPEEDWKNKVNAKDQSIRDVVKIELKGNKDTNARLSTKFWTKVFVDFKLTNPSVDTLPKPDTSQPVDPKLMETLGILRHDNPAARNVGPLERYLEFCPLLNRRTHFGMFHLVQEGPLVSRNHAMKAQNAILKYMARTGAHDQDADYWKIMKFSLDSALKWLWEEQYDKGVRILTFLKTHRATFLLYTDENDADDVIAAGENYSSVTHQLKRCMNTSRTMGSMYKLVWLSLSRVLFQHDIVRRLDELEDQNFMEDETESFTTICMREAEKLSTAGIDMYKKCSSEVNFLTRRVSTPMESGNDEWLYRLRATLKTIGLNTGQLEPLPWEKLLFRKGEMPGVPVTIKLPEPLLVAIRNGRSAAMDVLVGGRKRMTISKMRNLILGGMSAIREADRSFEVDLEFLDKHAEQMLGDQCKERFLAELPTSTTVVEIGDCVKALTALRESEALEACGVSLIEEFEMALKFIQNLGVGAGPHIRDAATYTEFYKTVLARAAYFFSYEDEGQDAAGKVTSVVKYGSTAVKDCFAKMRTAFDGDAANPGQHRLVVKRLKTFQWVLDNSQREEVVNWIKVMADAGEDCSSSSHAIVTLKDAQHWGRHDGPDSEEKKTSAEVKREEKEAAARSGLMSYFG